MATRRIEKILRARDIDDSLFFNSRDYSSFLSPNFSEYHRQQLSAGAGGGLVEGDFIINSMDEDTQEIYDLRFYQRFNAAGNGVRRYFAGEWRNFVFDRQLRSGNCVALTWAENIYALFLKVLIPGYIPRFRRSHIEQRTRRCVEFTNFIRRIGAIRRSRNRHNNQNVGQAAIVVKHAYGMIFITGKVGFALIGGIVNTTLCPQNLMRCDPKCKSLVEKCWFRRQDFSISKQLLQLVMEDAIDGWLLLQINWLRREDNLAQGILWVKDILWPDGKFFLKREITGSGSDDMDSHTFQATPRAASRKSQSSSFETQLEAARTAAYVKKMLFSSNFVDPSTCAFEAQIESDSNIDSDGAVIPVSAPKRKKKERRKAEETFDSDSESESDSDSEKDVLEQRIRENRERMENLGIFTLSTQLYNNKPKSKPKPQTRKRYPPLYPRSRPLTSARGGGGQYLKSGGLLEDLGIFTSEGWKAGVYTEQDELLLGYCQTPWTLKSDGFGKDGDRLYAPDGTPCHQCRQKGFAKLAYCGKCRSSHGILCGDCLYTRYGENVLEAVQNPSWSCPVCRGICNCNRRCRTKGWEPINSQHFKLVEKEFKSVSHFLIFTRRAGTTPNDLNDGQNVTVDLKREETAEPQQYEGSDYSAETSDSKSDSDDSDNEDHANGKKDSNVESVEKQVGSAVTFDEAAVATDKKDQVLQESTKLETLSSCLA